MMNEVDTKDLMKFQTVLELINEQFQIVMDSDPTFYSNYEFEIRNEQYFIPDDEREGHKIFIVVKFLPATLNLKQNILPVTIQAVSECNGVAAAQRLLLEYSQIFNLNTVKKDGQLIYQNYTSPNVISNFEVVYDGFRSLLVMAGTFLLSYNINRIKLLYFEGDNVTRDLENVPNEKITDLIEMKDKSIYKWEENGYEIYEGEEIEILNYTDNFDVTPDTQPYFSNKNFTKSVIKFGTFSFNIVSYLIKNSFNAKILKIISREQDINSNFIFKICFDDGTLNMPLLEYKLLNVAKQQNVGELPSIVTAFTN